MSTIETGIDKILCADYSTQIAKFDIENALKHATLSFHLDISGGWRNNGIITLEDEFRVDVNGLNIAKNTYNEDGSYNYTYDITLDENAQAIITFIADSNSSMFTPDKTASISNIQIILQDIPSKNTEIDKEDVHDILVPDEDIKIDMSLLSDSE